MRQMRSGILVLVACLSGCIATRERVPDGHVFPSEQCDAPADGDCDGIISTQDNCPRDANFEQGDIDGDGKGNACDPCVAQADDQCEKDRLAAEEAAEGEHQTVEQRRKVEADAKAVTECETAKKWLVDGRYASRVLSVLNNCPEAEIVAQAEQHWKDYEQKGYLVLSSQLAQIAGFELEAARIRRKALSGVQVSVATTVEMQAKSHLTGNSAAVTEVEGYIAKRAQQLITRWLQDFGATVVESAANVTDGYLLQATMRVVPSSSFDSPQEVADEVMMVRRRTSFYCPIQAAVFTATGGQGEVYTTHLNAAAEYHCDEHWARLPELIQQLAFARSGTPPAPEGKP